MKKIYFLLTLFLFGNFCFAQYPSYKQKLLYTCKVWGFVKYYHSRVSVCAVNWDSVLVHCLPLVKNAVTKNDFNNALDTMLLAAGPMALTTTPRPDTMSATQKRNLRFAWINDTILRADVQTILDTIKNNFRPHAECWVANNTYTTSNYSYLLLPADTAMNTQDTQVNFPDEWHRLLMLFRHWNLVNYFDPNNGVMSPILDSNLYKHVMVVDSATDDMHLYLGIRKINAPLGDMITENYTYDNYQSFPYQGP